MGNDDKTGFTWDDFDRLNVDAAGNLLWDGKRVQVEQKVSLRRFELVLATAATLATIAQAVAAFVR